jgi:uncharacterized protein YecE (DUF72 family)
MARFLVGTSGYSYKEWKGSFYPSDLPATRFLSYYAERLSTVEINNTFYRMPQGEQLQKWLPQVPASFVFVLKAPQRITHHKRLDNVSDDVGYFTTQAAALGDQLGPLLFQTPPNLKKDVPKLRGLLAAVPGRFRVALEFRHASWHDDEVFSVLREHKAALCCADTDDAEESAPLVTTAPWAYVRLRRADYDDAALTEWKAKLGAYESAFVFFKHEDAGAGPRLARRFIECSAAR